MRAIEWYEDDVYWNATYPFMFPDAKFALAAAGIPKLLALSGFDHGPVLDLCCGPGRHAVPLALSGLKITAVDRSSFLLERARAYAAKEGAEVEWVQSDMRNFVRPNAFSLALSMFTSFGYFEDLEDNRTVLRHIRDSLVPGGTFVIDVFGKEILARHYQPTQSEVLPNGDLLIQRIQIAEDWTKADSEWITIVAGKVQRFHIRVWCFSGQELKTLLLSAGFSEVSLFGSLEADPYGPEASRLIAVARK